LGAQRRLTACARAYVVREHDPDAIRRALRGESEKDHALR
jgi:hypothetical protein